MCCSAEDSFTVLSNFFLSIIGVSSLFHLKGAKRVDHRADKL